MKIKWFGSSWAPPAWMKTNGMLNGSGTLKGEAGGPYFRVYAHYLIRFVDEYIAQGVPMWGLTIQNEPNTGFADHSWNTCGFTSDQERDFIKFDLGPNLEAAGYTPDKLKVMILDHDRKWIPEWTGKIYTDPDVSKYVSGIALHWYINGDVTGEDMDQLLADYPDKFLLYTEASVVNQLDTIGLGDWRATEDYANDIMDDILHSVTGWVDWNLALDMDGGPNWRGTSWRAAPIHTNVDAGEWYKSPIFYLMGHYSKFISPGSVHVGIETGNRQRQFRLGYFQRPDDAIVVVACNFMTQPQRVALNDPVRGSVHIDVPAKSYHTWLYY